MSTARPVLTELVDHARTTTGLDDFGGDSWREGLEVLLHSAQTEARFNEQGKASLLGSIHQTLTNRLQIEDWLSRHPEIEDQEVHVELLGVGLPRTGSTALAHLLGEDPAIRSLRMWEASKPCPPPGVSPEDDKARIAAAEEAVLAMNQVSPRLRSMLPQSATGPLEDHDMLCLEFKSQVYLSMGRLPSYAAWLLDCDMEPAYRYERRVLQLLQWRSNCPRWQLKSPSHTLSLEAFEKVFPETRYVMTHREPARVLPSVSDVYCTLAVPGNESLDPVEMGKLNMGQWTVALSRCLGFRAEGREDMFFDIGFDAFQANPIQQVRDLYSWLGRELTGETAQRMRDWWATNRRKQTPTRPNPGDFGITEKALAAGFDPYRTRFSRFI